MLVESPTLSVGLSWPSLELFDNNVGLNKHGWPIPWERISKIRSMNKRTITLVDWQLALYKKKRICKSKPNCSKLGKYGILYEDRISILGFNYRDASIITFFPIVLVNSIQKIRWIG